MTAHHAATVGFGRITNFAVPSDLSTAAALDEIEVVAEGVRLPDGVILAGFVPEACDEGEYAASARFQIDAETAANTEAATAAATIAIQQALYAHFTGRST